MSQALQRIEQTREALVEALAERDWQAIGELDVACRSCVEDVLSEVPVDEQALRENLQSLLLERIRQRMTIIAPQVEAGIDWEKAVQMATERRSHGEMLERLGEVRYLLSLAVGEGFGLVPLEAMGMGTTVVGFDGFGGRDYVRHGDNCTLRAYPDIDGVADDLVRVLTDTGYAQSLARKGHETATRYTYERFRAAWIEEFQQAFRRKGF